jgi:NAD+ diphosphatase
MSSGSSIGFAGGAIDRADHIRSDPARLESLKDWRARLIRLDGLDPVMDADNALVWGTLADCPADAELVFLGLKDDRACFAAVPGAGESGIIRVGGRAWRAMGVLSDEDLAAYGMARSLVDWHARHRFCAVCGAATEMAKGGWQRSCTACNAQHFPRVDPVTIMLVEHDGKMLLGRQPRFEPGRYSLLAGFVEPGESIEEAVAREVLEEAGVVARDVSYVASQPWPFPSQLMIGCHAFADSPAITIDTTELDDARWFTRADVAQAMAAGQDSADVAFIAPPPQAIAHQLMKWWLEQ